MTPPGIIFRNAKTGILCRKETVMSMHYKLGAYDRIFGFTASFTTCTSNSSPSQSASFWIIFWYTPGFHIIQRKIAFLSIRNAHKSGMNIGHNLLYISYINMIQQRIFFRFKT